MTNNTTNILLYTIAFTATIILFVLSLALFYNPLFYAKYLTKGAFDVLVIMILISITVVNVVLFGLLMVKENISESLTTQMKAFIVMWVFGSLFFILVSPSDFVL